MTSESINPSNKSRKWPKFLIAAVVIIALLVLYLSFDVQGMLREGLNRIKDLGYIGMLAFIGMYVLACVFMVSGALLTLGAGAVWGVFQGTALASVASMAGATTAFLVGRYLARNWVSSKIEGNPKFKAIDEAVANEGWKIVGLVRLSPVFPFVLLNYAFGVTRVSLKSYFFASWIAMFPGTLMFAYMGSLAGDVATLGGGGADVGPMRWVFGVVGFIATVAVTILVTRIASKALKERVSIPDETQES